MAERVQQRTVPISHAPRIDVGESWQAAFDAFMESGRLDDDFRVALDSDEALKHAVDEAFRQQVAALGQIGRAFRTQRAAAREMTGASTATTATSTTSSVLAAEPGPGAALSDTLVRLANAPAEEQRAIIDDAHRMLVGAQRDPVYAPVAALALQGLSALVASVTRIARP